MPLLALSNVFELITRIILMALVVDSYGLEQYGVYSYAIIGTQFLVLSTMFGLGPAMVRFSELDLMSYEQVKIILCCVFIIFSVLSYFILGLEWFALYLFYFSLNCNTYYLTSINKQKLISIIRIISYFIIMSGFLIMGDLYSSMVYSYLLAALFLILFFTLNIKITLSVFQNLDREVIVYSTNSYLSQISTNALRFLERDVFSRFIDEESFGLYSILRDLTNAVVYVFYFPLQIFWIKGLIRKIKNKESLESFCISLFKYLCSLLILGFFTAFLVGLLSDSIKLIDHELTRSILSINLYLLTIICILDMGYKFFMVIKDAEGKPIISIFMNVLLALILLLQLLILNIADFNITIDILSYSLIIGFFVTLIIFIKLSGIKSK